MNIEELTVKDIRALTALLGASNQSTTHPDIDCGVKITILQRGWICVGHYIKNGDERRLENASVIRLWGTTNGLGELAANGKQSSTKLDPCGTVRFHALAEVASIDCNAEKWPLCAK